MAKEASFIVGVSYPDALTKAEVRTEIRSRLNDGRHFYLIKAKHVFNAAESVVDDLLAALREIAATDDVFSGDQHARCTEIARAAILKAEGRSS